MSDKKKQFLIERIKKKQQIGILENTGFVAYLDMLGMSNLTNKNPDYALELLLAIDNKVCSARDIRMTSKKSKRIISEPIIWTFSDSIIVVTKSDSFSDLLTILTTTLSIFTSCFSDIIPLRGAIAHGKILIAGKENNIFGGPALVRAHDIAEDTSWIGVVVDDFIEAMFHRIRNSYYYNETKFPFLIKWPVCTKSQGNIEMACLNWPITCEGLIRNVPIDENKFFESLSFAFGGYESLSSRVKNIYKATVDFINNTDLKY